MGLESLRVAQVQKNAQSSQSLASTDLAIASEPGIFFLNSCQRLLWVYFEDRQPDFKNGSSLGNLQIFKGVDAYRFLLRVASGLESQILGETDIFGQMKAALKNTPSLGSVVSFGVQKIFQQIFEDTKEIRSRYLENLGGTSYGSLVRKYFENRSAKVTLLVGAGALGESVAPYLQEGELLIFNRSVAKAETLSRGLKSATVVTPENESAAWARADRVIVCIPTDAAADEERVRAFLSGNGGAREILHLGCTRAQAGIWAEIQGAKFLDDLFRLQKSQSEARSLCIASAKAACDERAKLRGLGGSVSIAHGWEDLAIFA
ncbi:MAG: hypothetical protein P4M08_00595 [Oligoflexia bacterium]|nr:hypothetical protein [Oligoflexia bacterium]